MIGACALWALLLAWPARAQPDAETFALRRLDTERDAARQAIDEEFALRRKAMMASEAWSLSTDEERRQRLGALREEFRDHERRLEQQYESRRTQLGRDYEPRVSAAPGAQAQGPQGHQ